MGSLDFAATAPARRHCAPRRAPYHQAIEQLVTVVQQLSLARDLKTVMSIVRVAARELTGADGATFVLRDEGQCFYAEENAISPLWKGRRFPMSACISGWVMLHREPALIPDIYEDPRIPVDAYRPTFVRSLAMVPIRTLDPIGAIGNYWARRHRPTAAQIKLLQALADTTAVALENVRIYAELEQRVRDRTAALQVVNDALQAEIVERRKAEAEVRRLSMTDELTGLHDRRAFFTLAHERLADTAGTATLIFADVDRLKEANDALGHDVGDDLLRNAAAVLASCFGEGDIVARVGGDEFAVCVPSGADVHELQARVQRAIARFNATGTRPYTLSLSLGAATGASADTLADVIAAADEAMYLHKRAKKGARRRA